MKLYEAIKLSNNPFNKNMTVLYVGASHGKTVERLSKEVKIVYALDVSKKTTKELMNVAKRCNNIAPILADANKVEDYDFRIETVDFLFQDIAQKDQVRIFIKLMKHFKPKEAWLALKCKGIDSNKSKEEVVKEAKKELQEFNVIFDLSLDESVKDHHIFMVQL